MRTEVTNLQIANLIARCDKNERKLEEMEKIITEIRIDVVKIVSIGATTTAIVTPILVLLSDILFKR